MDFEETDKHEHAQESRAREARASSDELVERDVLGAGCVCAAS